MSRRVRPAAEIGGRARPPIGDDGREEARKAFGPCARASPVGDQVLPDLDQRIGQPARGGDRVDRVPGQGAVIGLVVADLADGEIRLKKQRLDQRLRRPVVAIPQIPIFQGRSSERMTGVNEWIEMSAGGSPVFIIASTVAAISFR